MKTESDLRPTDQRDVVIVGAARTAQGRLLGDAAVVVASGQESMSQAPGTSGARLAVKVVHELIRRETGRGAVALCGGRGQGDALLLER